MANDAPAADPLDFAAALLARAADDDLRKTERTRARLLAAIAHELGSGAARHDLKVAAVTRIAGIAHGTFYRYFPDMPAAVDTLIEAFSDFVQDHLAQARGSETGARERVKRATFVFARLFRRNAGLMRCLIGLTAAESAFAGAYRRLNRDWYGRVAGAIAKGRQDASAADAHLPAAYALGGMIDEFLAQIYLRKEPALAHLAEDEEKIADLLTDLWCFGAYGASDRNAASRSE
ncbi:MAG TPA: TetR/AcrR family transcriptional regulator [Nordella sp.]|nr:TetR/AcrR family transcriptional regulator [Nordella sp.]